MIGSPEANTSEQRVDTSGRRLSSAPPRSEAELVRTHADLVRRIAHHLAARLPSSVEVDDLIQAGIIGLIEAARHYSGDRGASFETYAGIRIRGAMLDELRKGDWVPRSVHRRAREIAEAIRAIEARTGHEASDAEIAQALGMPLEAYHRHAEDAARAPLLSLDDPGAGDRSLADTLEDPETPERATFQAAFREALADGIAELPDRERTVMGLYYQDELNLKEIGRVLGVSESRVCQLHSRALLRLRARLQDWRSVAVAA